MRLAHRPMLAATDLVPNLAQGHWPHKRNDCRRMAQGPSEGHAQLVAGACVVEASRHTEAEGAFMDHFEAVGQPAQRPGQSILASPPLAVSERSLDAMLPGRTVEEEVQWAIRE